MVCHVLGRGNGREALFEGKKSSERVLKPGVLIVAVASLALQEGEADERCLPTGLGRSGQPTLTGLHGLSNHC